MGFFSDLGKAIKSSVSHGPWDPRSSVMHSFRTDREARRKKNRLEKTEQEQIAAEAEMVDQANMQLAANRRRRRLSSLFAGGRSVLGAPAGRGSPTTSSSAGSSAVAGGSAMGGGSRSFGGNGTGTGRGDGAYN